MLSLAAASVLRAEELHPEYPRMVRSAYWRPYPLDGVTTRLYHLDELGTASETEVLREKEAEPELLTAPESGREPGTATRKREVVGASRGTGMGQPGQLKGACEPVGKGKFGGGLRFQGPDGVLVCPNVDWDVGQTLEFWLLLEELPPAGASLANLKTTESNAYSLALQVGADGSLCPVWNEKALEPAEAKLVPGAWRHLALEWSYFQGILAIELLLEGKIARKWDVPYNWSQHCSTRRNGVLLIGNDSGAKHGIRGLVDEVRLSGVLRRYYAPDLDWLNPGAPARAKEDQPYFRDPEDLLFHLAFDGKIEPSRSGPGTVTTAAREPDIGEEGRYYAPGVQGQGLLLGHGGLGPAYEGEGNLDTRAGTVAFWMLPVDWDNYTRDNRFDGNTPCFLEIFHVLGSFPGGGAPERWESAVPLMRFVILQNPLEFVHHPVDFNPGRWVHLAVTWDKETVQYFADGKSWPHAGSMALVTCDNDYWLWGKPGRPPGTAWTHKARARTIRFQKLGRWLWHPYWHPGRDDPHTVIDDFRVYQRALSPTEIGNLAALRDPRKELVNLPPAEMTVRYNGVLRWVETEAHPLVAAYKSLKDVTIELAKEGDARPAVSKAFSIDPLHGARARLDTGPLDFGTYQVTASFKDEKGVTGAKATESFSRVKPPWWGTNAGLSDKVMPDWEPVRVRDNVVSVVLRDIHFAPSGLPERVVSAGEDVLAGPVALAASYRSKAVPLAPVPDAVRVNFARETQVDLAGGLKAPDWQLTTEVHVEFDGMMWFKVTLAAEAGRPASIDSLVLRIPYRAGNAQLTHWWSGAEPEAEDNTNFPALQQHLGALPAGQGVVLRSNDPKAVRLDPRQRGSFMPYILLTGMKRGMAWFAVNDKGWTQSKEVPALSVVREGDVVALLLNVISSEVVLRTPLTFEFGLHPVPVKKLDPNWRMWPGWGVQPDFGGTFRGGASAWNSMLPEKEDWEAVARLWEEGKDDGARRLKERQAEFLKGFRARHGRDPEPSERPETAIYTCLPDPGPPPAHTQEWEQEWYERHRHPYRDRLILTRGFLDFASWCWGQWFAHGLVKGIYVDGSNLLPQWGSRGPYAYALPDGHDQPGYQFLGVREYMKRMRQASWDSGVVPHICCHMTNQHFIPQLSFVDVMLDGEDKYSSPGKPTDFLDHWAPDRMRLNHIGKWGIVPKWLGWHVETPRKDGSLAAWEYRQDRAWIANLALHDIQWQFGGPYSEGAASAFGLTEPDTVFVPYWDLGGLARVTKVTPAPQKAPKAKPGEAAKETPLRGPGGTDPVYISAWKRPGKCLVLLVNWSEERLEAEVAFDRERLGLGTAAAGDVVAEDVDTGLIPPPAVDFLTLETPKMTGKEALSGTDREEEDADGEAVEEEFKEKDETNLTPAEQRAKHPDAQFSWQDGVLRCPIRRHDFRLFEFRCKERKP